ncbi:MAG: HlyD family efflux transporter periplasmic adaptor subunit [Planctomycetes bacterium]|nr:HlyD family efflux transporter periplasmic adaptor subunit [Planctomycetota bacterium]MCH9723510.1 HlyD family efflux transporter periplasmic adaptor subunit [Planctomycetota bacterium]MCH9775303.1 HlyD family efflux transporter periplasmic adaptor subunit [Planctomycetota bacterium]MCH9789210.1 HlyD family efflux transporter periplasmic adaptor subunit [Planctomycetota bacterium]
MTLIKQPKIHIRRYLLLILLCVILSTSCKKAPEQESTPAPLPVTVFELKESRPSSWNRLTASIASWKTENVGFEVAGRVQFVVEPETDVSGVLYGSNTKQNQKPALLARLDPTRYELAVESAKASVNAELRRRDATKVEIKSVIPAQLRAAEAERVLADVEMTRSKQLIASKAISKSEYDRYTALLAAKTAAKDQLTGTLEQRKADLASIEATVNRLQQDLAEANRDLKDTSLLSSYPAQVSQVHAIPGAYVERGSPVCTVQMMDPMRVDVEVSSQMARNIQHGNRFPVFIRQQDGSELEMGAFVYMIDPTADPETRTFTVTLFVRNNKTKAQAPPELKDVPFARTASIFQIVRGLGNQDPNRKYIAENAIQKDKQGLFLYKILNRQTTTLGRTNPVLQVDKVRVNLGEEQIKMLGLLTFQEVKLATPEKFNLDSALFTGPITVPSQKGVVWDGKTVLEDRRRWQLRPGDLVSVELGIETQPGFYVPLNSVRIEKNRKYLFTVSPEKKVKKIEISSFENVGKLIRVLAAGGQKLATGSRVVLGQAHYLQDGEPVNIVEEVEVRP